ncbi:hypothetical protein HZA76_05075 [Candidatus Roizmanbacteria bacterium]|nr:hypothetical protein [Candidatus Roizmanbacteria bacterium]
MTNFTERTAGVIQKMGKTLRVYTTQSGFGPLYLDIDTHINCILNIGDEVYVVGENPDFQLSVNQLGIYAFACSKCPVRPQCESYKSNKFK